MNLLKLSALALCWLGSLSCKSQDVRAIIIKETRACVDSQMNSKDLLAVVEKCQLAAIDRNKAMISRQLKLDTSSQRDMLNLYVGIAALFFADSSIGGRQREMIDSLRKKAAYEQKNVGEGLVNAGKNGTAIEGKFLKLERVGDHIHLLTLKVGDSTMTFQTVAVLDSMEISMLKKEGNNIQLTYTEHFNPVTKQTDKLVRAMVPIYGK